MTYDEFILKTQKHPFQIFKATDEFGHVFIGFKGDAALYGPTKGKCLHVALLDADTKEQSDARLLDLKDYYTHITETDGSKVNWELYGSR